MNRKVILGVTCFVIVVVLVILLSRTKENYKYDPFRINPDTMKGCRLVDDEKACDDPFNVAYLMHDMTVPNNIGIETNVSGPMPFPSGGTMGMSTPTKTVPVDVDRSVFKLCCDSVESFNNARHELKLAELDKKIMLLNNLLPKNVRNKINIQRAFTFSSMMPQYTNDKTILDNKNKVDELYNKYINDKRAQEKAQMAVAAVHNPTFFEYIAHLFGF
jgi:hypothetical protein